MKLSDSKDIELKSKYVKSINKSIIAFANSRGGTIYIGVNDDGSVEGINNPEDTLLKITNSIRDSVKPDVTLFTDCTVEILDGKSVIKIIVEQGTESPYYLYEKGIRPEGVYVRQGASSVPASQTAILNMIKDTDGNSFEGRRSIEQNLTFSDTEKIFRNKKISFGDNQKRSLKIIDEKNMYTNLALLLSDQCTHTIKLAIFEGTDKEIFRDRKELTGSLLKQLDEAFNYIDLHNKTHAEIKGYYRVDQRDYNPENIREAILNSLVHREYSFSGSTLISIFDDRIEFVSIGGLIRGITINDIMLGTSLSRNENLANVFYRLDLIEAYGTGIPRIMKAYRDHKSSPMIETSDNAFKITLPNLNTQPVVKEERVQYFTREGDNPVTNDIHNSNEAAYLYAAMSDSERTVMKLFDNKLNVVRKDVEKALSVSQPMAVKVLKKLVDSGMIFVVGGGRSTRYIKSEAYDAVNR